MRSYLERRQKLDIISVHGEYEDDSLHTESRYFLQNGLIRNVTASEDLKIYMCVLVSIQACMRNLY